MTADSRGRIVEILKRRGEASVTELSQALGLTAVTIRHHLDALLEEQVVSEPAPRKKPGPGRPEMVYTLTRRAEALTPRNYGELCACLLESLGNTPVDAAWLLTSAGKKLMARAGTAGARGPQSALAFLESRGYFPSLDRSQDRPAVILANCPYLEVARSHPQVCRFDLSLLESLLGVPVTAETSIALNDPYCRIRLGSPAVI